MSRDETRHEAGSSDASFAVSATAPPEPSVAQSLFSFGDAAWPLMVAAGVAVALYLDSRVTVQTDDALSFSLSVGFVGGMYAVAAMATVFAQVGLRRRAARRLADALRGGSQFLVFDDRGIRFGTEGIFESFWSWQTCGLIKWVDDRADMIVRVGWRRMRIRMTAFSEDERRELRAQLVRRGLLRGEPRHKDLRLTRQRSSG